MKSVDLRRRPRQGPGTFRLSPKLVADEGGTVTFSVSDVGDPVEGETITVDRETLATDAQGKATFTVPKDSKPGALAAKAQKTRYAASVKVTVAPKLDATRPS